jgi:hypothetical protein
MGFDPRGRERVTANVQALLTENDSLRRQVRSLQLQLERLRQEAGPQEWGPGAARVTTGAAPAISPAQVERWGRAMARHPRWSSLRIGPPGGLRSVVEEQRRRWWDPRLDLEQELDRRSPGLGSALAAALRGPHSRCRWAVRAAFALYGQRASEWLSEEPLRVVEELLRLQEQQRRSGQSDQQRRSQPGDQQRDRQRQSQQRRGTRTANTSDGPGSPHQAALRLLGLEQGASLEAIKRAYRRLAKAHHPDLGGDAAAFQAVEAAYRLLLGRG